MRLPPCRQPHLHFDTPSQHTVSPPLLRNKWRDRPRPPSKIWVAAASSHPTCCPHHDEDVLLPDGSRYRVSRWGDHLRRRVVGRWAGLHCVPHPLSTPDPCELRRPHGDVEGPRYIRESARVARTLRNSGETWAQRVIVVRVRWRHRGPCPHWIHGAICQARRRGVALGAAKKVPRVLVGALELPRKSC